MTVTVAGPMGKDLARDMENHSQAGRDQRRRREVNYTVVIEKTSSGNSAYVPDLPGCVAAADTRVEVEELIGEAILMHVDSLREHDEPIPEPQASVTTVSV